jgi:TatD DNase family protein
MHLFDAHTHNIYKSNTIFVYNSFLKEKSTLQYISVGIHPWYIGTVGDQIIRLETLLKSEKNIVAIGECGLDKLLEVDWNIQLQVFELQLEMAQKYQLPVIIHCVKAYNECLSILKKYPNISAIFHGYNKHQQLAQSIINKGYYLSLGKDIIKHPSKYINFYKNFSNYILLETDESTDVSLLEIYQQFAEISNTPLETVNLQIKNNFNLIFQL